MPVAVYTTDGEGRIQLFNPAAVELWGRTPETGQEQWCGSHRMYWPDGSSLPRNRCPMAMAIQMGSSLEGVEAVVERPDGTRRNVLAHPRVKLDSRGQVTEALNILVDITERKNAERMQELLRETQHVESVGLLAGGIAQDFNDILVSVLGNASIAAGMLEQDSPVQARLKEIESAAEYAAHLVRQLLAYAGKSYFVTEPVQLSDLVRDTVDLVRANIPPDIRVQMDLAADLPAIQADRTQIQQVVINLLNNATDAVRGQAGEIGISTSSEGTCVRLSVRDTGSGMDEATKARIFDPFFTTKLTGRGLGLAAAAGIVRGHKGSIEVVSEPGRGSTFVVRLPGT
jgi:PAS domain S-box-containing protein